MRPFVYTAVEWKPIAKEIGSRRWWWEHKIELEEIATSFLADPAPKLIRTQQQNRRERAGSVFDALLDLADAMEQAGYVTLGPPGDNLRDAVRWFEPEDLRDIAYSVDYWADMETREEPQAHGPADPSRQDYLDRLSAFWATRLNRRAGASFNGTAGGPMVRFLTAAANPALNRRGAKLLSANAARAAIRDYQKREAERQQWRNESQENASLFAILTADPP